MFEQNINLRLEKKTYKIAMLVVYFFACLLPMDEDVRRASHQIFPADRHFVT